MPTGKEREDGPRTSAELRVLRQGPAAGCYRSADLQLRVHVLRRLRRNQATQCLPQLRRRLRASADPPGNRVAARSVGRQAPALQQTRAPLLRSGRHRLPHQARRAHSAGGALSAQVSLSGYMSKKQIVHLLKERWRTERMYEDLKGELGLDHFE